ncbi:MAG: hypothetical protein ABR527_08900 [Gemmatimonadota bacterium]
MNDTTQESPSVQDLTEKLEDALKVLGLSEKAAARWDDLSLSVAEPMYFTEIILPIVEEIGRVRGNQTQAEYMKDELEADAGDQIEHWNAQRGEPGPGKSLRKEVGTVMVTRRQLIASAIEMGEATNLFYSIAERLNGSHLEREARRMIDELREMLNEVGVLLLEDAGSDPTWYIAIGEREQECWRDEAKAEAEQPLQIVP